MFDCARIKELGIDKKENFPGGSHHDLLRPEAAAAPCREGKRKLAKNCCPAPVNHRDFNLITGTETSPKVTQSEHSLRPTRITRTRSW